MTYTLSEQTHWTESVVFGKLTFFRSYKNPVSTFPHFFFNELLCYRILVILWHLGYYVKLPSSSGLNVSFKYVIKGILTNLPQIGCILQTYCFDVQMDNVKEAKEGSSAVISLGAAL